MTTSIVEAREKILPSMPDHRNSSNKLDDQDRAAHSWYRFVLSFPPHLVRQYIKEFGLGPTNTVLDPFCGTGTTLVECKKLGIPSIGIEANPVPHFASCVKTDWSPSPDSLLAHAQEISQHVYKQYQLDGIVEDAPLFSSCQVRKPVRLLDLPPETYKLLLANSISPLPLHKTLILLENITKEGSKLFAAHEKLALASALVNSISNLHFGPEVGVGKIKKDAAVLSPWMTNIQSMAEDLQDLGHVRPTPTRLHFADSRRMLEIIEPHSIDAVFTSPPYPNEKDYTRTTRLESVLLGFLKTKEDLRKLKQTLIRSNTRGVYRNDDDDKWISDHPEIFSLADEIENRRIEMGKTSGFERMYHRVAKLYFGGMSKHLSELREGLKPGALLAYVVGDQASYLRVMIRTGQLLAGIAQNLGYELVRIDLFRTRLATATRQQLREEVVVLRWPGKKRGCSRRHKNQ